MRFFCIDYGLERTGISACDPEEHMAFPVRTLSLSSFPSRKALLDALASLLVEGGCEACVFGLPLSLAGEETLTSRQVRNIASRLSHRIVVPIYFMNEALTSALAYARLQEAGVRGAKRKAVLDQQAAVCILDAFLKRLHEEGETFLSSALAIPRSSGGGA